MEDYKKKYKYAMESMREWIAPCHTQEQLDNLKRTIFPELAISEDEKIRKELICFLNTEIPQCEARDKYTSWLEKQAEQKPQRMISAEAKEAMYGKPAYAWSEKDEKEYKYVLKFVDNTLNNCGNKKDYEHCKRCYDWLKSLKQKIGGKQ